MVVLDFFFLIDVRKRVPPHAVVALQSEVLFFSFLTKVPSFGQVRHQTETLFNMTFHPMTNFSLHSAVKCLQIIGRKFEFII